MPPEVLNFLHAGHATTFLDEMGSSALGIGCVVYAAIVRMP